jgi:hypothetical protein
MQTSQYGTATTSAHLFVPAVASTHNVSAVPLSSTDHGKYEAATAAYYMESTTSMNSMKLKLSKI